MKYSNRFKIECEPSIWEFRTKISYAIHVEQLHCMHCIALHLLYLYSIFNSNVLSIGYEVISRSPIDKFNFKQTLKNCKTNGNESTSERNFNLNCAFQSISRNIPDERQIDGQLELLSQQFPWINLHKRNESHKIKFVYFSWLFIAGSNVNTSKCVNYIEMKENSAPLARIYLKIDL